MRHIRFNDRCRARSVAVSIALVLLIATACSNATAQSVAERGDPALVAAPLVGADVDQQGLVEPAPTAGAVALTTDAEIEPSPEPDPTPVPAAALTPGSDKNQPVYRQARLDGDSRAAPVQIRLEGDRALREISEELSAFTDRTDAFRVLVATTTQEIVVQWLCESYQSEDGRPFRLSVERGGAVLSQFRCDEAGASGSTRVQMGDGPVDIVADINGAQGAELTNMFVAYSLTVRSIEARDTDGDTDDATSPQAPEPTATAVPGASSTPVPDTTPLPDATPVPGATPTLEATPTPEATPSPEATASPDPTPTPEPRPAPTYVDTPSSRRAPADGDSRTNPAQLEDDGFLFGAVSAPAGDSADWSTFVVGPEDPTELFAGVRCDEFESPDGSGVFTLRVSAAEAVVAELVCTDDVREDFALLEFTPGTQYLVQAEFTGVGYTNWSFEARDDD